MPNGWFSPSRKISRLSATPSPSASRNSVMRFGADAKGGGAPHRRLHRVVEHAPDRSGDLRRLGDEHVAIGQHVDPARMLQTGRERVDLEPGRRHRRLPVAPSPGRRHLERRDAALRLRRRDRRRAAPGRLVRDALQPAPQRSRRRRSARPPAQKCRTSSCHSPVDRAHTIRRGSVLKPCRRRASSPALRPRR